DYHILNASKINSFNANQQKEILEIFLRDSTRLLEGISKNKTAGNIETLHFNIHALKGISGNIGAERLLHITKEIDLDLKQGQLPKNENWFDILQTSYHELRDIIRQLIKDL